MPFSATAIMLTKAIEASELTQREVADRVGFRQANIISMLGIRLGLSLRDVFRRRSRDREQRKLPTACLPAERPTRSAKA